MGNRKVKVADCSYRLTCFSSLSAVFSSFGALRS
jgi:hypothetical protein